MFALIFSLAVATQTHSPTVPVELPGVTVVGGYFDYLLRVDLRGTDAASDLVVSVDPAMNCGDARFDRTPGPYRQCWLRGRRGAPILLTAQHEGVFGRDWTVDWTGCEPVDDGRSCSAAIAGTMQVGATFRAM